MGHKHTSEGPDGGATVLPLDEGDPIERAGGRERGRKRFVPAKYLENWKS